MLRQWLWTRSTQPENAYGPFVEEILKAEGLNGFETLDLDRTPMPDPRPGDLVILTRCFLRNAEAERLVRAVENGCRLLCIEPQWDFVRRFGWEPGKRVVSKGRVRPAANRPGAGHALQTHVHLTVQSPGKDAAKWEVLAEALHADGKPAGCPAAAQGSFGKGKAAFFFYDLPKAVAAIRFGDPDLASSITLGWDWTHPMDLFTGHVDLELARLPQADFHSQLLAQALTELSPAPLARLWYYESPEQRSAACISSDDDWSTPEQFEDLSSTVLKHGGRITFYLVEETALTKAQVDAYRAKGHSFGSHMNAFKDGAEHYYFGFPVEMKRETEALRKRFDTASISLQAHCGPWIGYQTWLPEFIKNGYRMLFPYFSNDCFNAYVCGSGRPIKFFTPESGARDCWQQALTTWDDASLIPRFKEKQAEMVAEFEAMLEASLKENHTAIGLASHPISFSTYSKPYFEIVLGKLAKEGVPVYSGDDWCAFQDRRHAVRLKQEQSGNGALTVTVSNLAGRQTLMVPLSSAGGSKPDVRVNGTPARASVERRLGGPHLFVPLEGSAKKEDLRVEIAYSK